MSDSHVADAALTRLSQLYPSFHTTQALDALRAREYARLDASNQVYLDYTGGGLYASSQIQAHTALLLNSVLGNPHSSNPTSLAATLLVEQARRAVLQFFHADTQEYLAIFTLNASAALKLVGESYPFEEHSCSALTFDNHNSVNGIREFARAHGATTRYVPVVLPDMRADEAHLLTVLEQTLSEKSHLFAYPAQSNFSGVQHPLEWIELAHARGWDVLLDAAAFVPTNRLDLSRWHPDFVSLSFYKMFGYPTGVGCLLARWQKVAKLRRPWFAGGTITVASVQGDQHFFAEDEAAFEDGTLNYLALPAIEIGLRHLETIGLEIIHERVQCLTGWLLEQIQHVRHTNGQPLVKVYGPPNLDDRGGTIALNLYHADGTVLDHRIVEKQASQAQISLRTGCFCNPGGGEIALNLSERELTTCFHQPGHENHLTLDDFRLCLDGKSSGAVRISFGPVSNVADVERFLQFLRQYIDT